MGDVLKAAVKCIEVPSLYPRELHILVELAGLASDRTGPELQKDGSVVHEKTGLIRSLVGDDHPMARWMKADALEGALFVLLGTGWLKEAEGPEFDGAYKLNIARLERLLQVAEANMAGTGTGERPDPADADQELPGDFDAAPPPDVAAQVDRLLIRNPA